MHMYAYSGVICLLTNSIDSRWLLLWAETAIGHVDVGVSASSVTSVELTLAQVHLRLPQFVHFYARTNNYK